MKKIILLFTTIILMSATPAFAQNRNVQKGDSMWKLSKRYHVLFKDVLRLNLKYPNQNVIHPGDKIELPEDTGGNENNQNSSEDNITDGTDEIIDRGESTQANEVLKLVNEERKKHGLAL